MPKKPKPLSSVRRKRRPKSIYAKGWETRRLRAQGIPANVAIPNAMVGGDPNVPLTTGLTTQSRSEVSGGDALLRMAMMHRDDQLCGFLGDMNAMRMMRMPAHAPMMLSRAQAEAIEEFLIDHGYSLFGKGSGAFASVSTKPTVDKAA